MLRRKSRNNAVECVTRLDLISIQVRHKFPKQVSAHNLAITCARLWELNVTVNCVRLLLYIAKVASQKSTSNRFLKN